MLSKELVANAMYCDYIWERKQSMHKPMKPVVVALLMIVLAIGSPVLSAQNKQPKSPTAATSTAEGKILWQYNTHG